KLIASRSLEQILKEVIPKYESLLDMSRSFQWNPLPFNFCGPGDRQELATYLHQHSLFSRNTDLLRQTVKGWFLLEKVSEKGKLVSNGRWQALMECIARSEYLYKDIRAVLLNDGDTLRKRFFGVCIDSFAQATGKSLRTSQAKARKDWLQFEEILKTDDNPYVDYRMPRVIPGKLRSYLRTSLY